jgi:hypothetical protein
MAYVAVDKSGKETVFLNIPYREGNAWHSDNWHRNNDSSDYLEYAELPYIELPKGSIEKLLGRKLTWLDEPVLLEEDSQKRTVMIPMHIDQGCDKYNLRRDMFRNMLGMQMKMLGSAAGLTLSKMMDGTPKSGYNTSQFKPFTDADVRYEIRDTINPLTVDVLHSNVRKIIKKFEETKTRHENKSNKPTLIS